MAQQQQQAQENPFLMSYRPNFFNEKTSLRRPDGCRPGSVPSYYKLLQVHPQADEHTIRETIEGWEDEARSVASANLGFMKEVRRDLLDPVARQRYDLAARQIGTYNVMFLESQGIRDFHESNSWNRFEEFSAKLQEGIDYDADSRDDADYERYLYVTRLDRQEQETQRLLSDAANHHQQELIRERQNAVLQRMEAKKQGREEEKARAGRSTEIERDLMTSRRRRAVAAGNSALERVKEASAANYRALRAEAEAEEAMSIAKVRNDPLFPVRAAEYRAAVAAALTATSSLEVLREIMGDISVTAEQFEFGLDVSKREVDRHIEMAARHEYARIEAKKEEEGRIQKAAAARIFREHRDKRLAREQQEAREKTAQREKRECRNRRSNSTRPASSANQTGRITKSKSKPPTSRAQQGGEALLEALEGESRASGAAREQKSRATRVKAEPLNEEEGEISGGSRQGSRSPSIRAENEQEEERP